MRPAGSRVVALRALCECRGLRQSCVPSSLLSVKSSEVKFGEPNLKYTGGSGPRARAVPPGIGHHRSVSPQMADEEP
jgi:hypothetical protein